MALMRLFLKPGIDKQNTEYGAEGGWTDGDYIRFRYGLPEKIGGWSEFGESSPYFIGVTSEVFTWNDLEGSPYIALGTNRKLYVFYGGTWFDITPLRVTTTAGEVTFAATSGSSVITVTDNGHGAITGDFVTFSGVAAGGLGGDITQAILQSEFEITLVLTSNTYTITAPVNANASDSGNGGASVVGAYQINVGSAISFDDFGWGTGTWGLSTWNTPRPASAGLALFSRVWQFDTFGQVLIAQLVDDKIYEWDPSSGTGVRATVITDAPTKSKYALVSTPDRHLVCFGTETTIGTPATQDPMFVRFSSQENPNQFEESVTNTAGGQRLTDGSRIVTAVRSRGQILIWTDTSLHGQQFIGPPYTFGFQQLGANCGCIGPHAAVDVNGVSYWMSSEAFYVFDGSVKKIPCTVQDYVFKDIDLSQSNSVHAGVNAQFNEVSWWYASENEDYINRFVTYNYLENVWSIGTMARTSWADMGVFTNPLATDYDPDSTETSISTIYGLTAGRSQLYRQEYGHNGNGGSIASFITSGFFDLGDGDNMMFMSRFIPDFSNQLGDLTVRLRLRAYPQANIVPSSLDPYTVTTSTQKIDTRARGRQISLKIESDAVDTNWRYGTLRVDIRPDGLR
jgi:hypothetical protein